MEQLNVKAAVVSGALTSGVLHAIFGVLYLGSPGMMQGMYSMMMYNSVQFGMGAFSASNFIGSIIVGAVFGAVLGWLIAVTYNYGLRVK